MLPQRNRTSEALHHSKIRKIGQNRPKSQIPFINTIYPKIANFLQLLSHFEKYTSWDWRSWKGPRAKVHCKCIYSSGKAVKITIKLYIFVLLLSGGCGGSYWEFSKLPRILLFSVTHTSICKWEQQHYGENPRKIHFPCKKNRRIILIGHLACFWETFSYSIHFVMFVLEQ